MSTDRCLVKASCKKKKLPQFQTGKHHVYKVVFGSKVWTPNARDSSSYQIFFLISELA